MITNLIIGAGQLGSRHLQGLLKYNEQIQKVYVIDPSESSLNLASDRANEIKHNHEVFYSKSLKDLPNKFDLAIIATNSDIRETVLNQLLENHFIKYLILEKVLFNDLEAYERVSKLLQIKQAKAWVNHPRRMFKSYQSLKALHREKHPSVFQMIGGDWGLGCNGLHFIDFFVYLAESEVAEIDAHLVDQKILRSKREGFIEFTGTIRGKLVNGSTFQISSLLGDPSPGTISIFNTQSRIIIHEQVNPQIFCWDIDTNLKLEVNSFEMEYQSSMTTSIAELLFHTGSCLLPSFEDARNTHELFLKALLLKYNESGETHTKILPIT